MFSGQVIAEMFPRAPFSPAHYSLRTTQESFSCCLRSPRSLARTLGVGVAKRYFDAPLGKLRQGCYQVRDRIRVYDSVVRKSLLSHEVVERS